MSRPRIALVGAGLMGRRHIALVTQSPACRLAAVVDPAPAAGRAAEETGAPVLSSLAELLDGDLADAVILATPNTLHVPQTLLCIKAGLPVLVEKPVAASLAEGRRLLEAAESSGVPVLVGHHRQHNPIIAKAREIVASGLLGRLVAVAGSALFYKPASYFAEAPWRSQPGGGPILINMIHEVGNLRALAGEIVAVQAMASSRIRGLPVEDSVAVNLRFDNGALGSFLLSDAAASAQSWEQTARENPHYASYDDVDCYSLVGTEGSLGIPTLRLRTYGAGAEPSWSTPFESRSLTVERADPFARQLDHFCAVIDGRAEPAVTVTDGLKNLAVTEAIARAAASGETVSQV